ncbi:MAG: S8 family serine peptidase [Gemmataceae bacterium]
MFEPLRPWRRLAVLLVATALAATVLPGPQSVRSAEESSEELVQRERERILSAIGATRWHQAGFRGQGIKVAILDSGFRGYRDHLGKALPKQVTVKSFRQDGDLEARDSQHGILCAEIIHAVAPAAELLFANWDTDQPQQYLKAAQWARQQGARIISCSIIMPSWSDGEGGGDIANAFADILGRGDRKGDVVCFASAGNTAERHWAGNFKPGENGWHQWETGKTQNAVSPWNTDRVSVELYYKTGADYDLVVVDQAGKRVGRMLEHPGNDRSCRVVVFLPEEWNNYRVLLRLRKGEASPFHLVVLGGGLAMARKNGSIPFPGDTRGVCAVGAVYDDGNRASYSSCGPNSVRPKPDLVATIPFPSLWRERPFTGTSAAAPQAAGLAALVWSMHPDWSADKVRFTLQSAARDLGPTGHDHETGFGHVSLPASLLEPSASRP